MHILYLHQYFHSPKIVGATRSYEFARRFVESGHNVTIVRAHDVTAPWEGKDLLRRDCVDGINIVTVRAGYGSGRYGTMIPYSERIYYFAQFALASCWAVLRVPKPDIVFATSTPLTIGIPGVFASKAWRVPLVFEVRDPWPESPIQMGALRHPLLIAVARWLERAIYRNSAHIVALSPGTAECIKETGISAEKISIIPNSSDLMLFRPDNDGSSVRRHLGLEDKFVCLYFGAMGEANDLKDVVRAAQLLQEQGDDDIVFHLLGHGKCRPMLEAFCRENGITNVLFSDSVSKEKVPEWVAASDICMVFLKNLPIMQTCSPNKFFDSLAAGRPVLINIAGWLRDLVEQYEIGVYVEPDSAESIVEKVILLRDHPELCAQYGKNARNLAEEHFARDEMAQKLERVLLRVV